MAFRIPTPSAGQYGGTISPNYGAPIGLISYQGCLGACLAMLARLKIESTPGSLTAIAREDLGSTGPGGTGPALYGAEVAAEDLIGAAAICAEFGIQDSETDDTPPLELRATFQCEDDAETPMVNVADFVTGYYAAITGGRQAVVAFLMKWFQQNGQPISVELADTILKNVRELPALASPPAVKPDPAPAGSVGSHVHKVFRG